MSDRFFTERLTDKRQLGFSDKINFQSFVDEGVIFHHDSSYVFQKSYWCNGFDFESAEDHEITSITNYLNLVFAGMGTGWVLHINQLRLPDNSYLNTAKNCFESELLKQLDREREYFFKKEAILFQNKTAITFTYIAQNKKINQLGEWFKKSTKVKTPSSIFDLTLVEFKQKINQITKLLNRALRITAMNDDETVSYLNYVITGKWVDFKLPTKSYIDLRYLLGDDYINGLEPKIGSKHLKIIAIDNYFPNESYPLMLERLNKLGFAFRWSTRFFFVNKLEAQKNISRLSDLHEQNIVGVKGMATYGTNLQSSKFNRGASYLFEEAEEAIANSMLGKDNHGKYSCNIILYDEDENKLVKQQEQVESLLQEMGFKTRNETINSEEAFLGSIDGDIYHNRRRSMISTENLADLMPLSGFWRGLEYHPSNLYPALSNPMFMVDCNSWQSFKSCLHVSDAGHSLIIGKNGSGKSVLVNFLISSHMRYENAQFFGFDNKRSMMPLTYGANGAHYDLGVDNTSFQPLADIDTITGYDFAVDWVQTLCELSHLSMTTTYNNAIRAGLSELKNMPVEFRTMLGLYAQIKGSCAEVGDVVKQYCGDDSLQARVLSANLDRIKLNSFNVFEMEQIINKGDAVVIPVLKYLFYKISQRFDGRPTLIVIEEAWMAFQNPVFAKKLEEWLKTLRKQNVYIIMVTLQVQEIANSSIRSSLLQEVSTLLFTPNPELKKTEVRSAYEKIGLSDTQINLLQYATPKQEYYITNENGQRLFNLDMDYFAYAKAFSCRISIDDLQQARELKQLHGDGFAQEWLKYCGVK
jgi:type IV secretion system protein TrbE